jgi:predicted dehydrogenase
VLGWENAFTNQAADFLAAVRDRDPAAYSPDFEDGLALQRVLEAIIASDAADGATVRL